MRLLNKQVYYEELTNASCVCNIQSNDNANFDYFLLVINKQMVTVYLQISPGN